MPGFRVLSRNRCGEDGAAKRRLKRGVFRSVVDLQEAINRFIAETNSNPKPFVWTAEPARAPRRHRPRGASVELCRRLGDEVD